LLAALLLTGCAELRVLPAADPMAGRKRATPPPIHGRPGVTVLAHEAVPLDEPLVPELLPPAIPERSVVGGRTVSEGERRASKLETARPDAPPTPGSRDLVAMPVPVPPPADATPSERGRHLYALHCATCHGPTGRGDGPSGPALLYPPADLTRVAERRGGVFVAAEIAAHLDGQVPHPSHGSADQPIWGPELRLGDAHGAQLDALLRYLETLQPPLAEEEAVL
jgi:mono/diheme cytochrome c family protein